MNEADEQVDEEARKKFYDKTYDLAAGAVDRSRNAADMVQKSGAAIVSIYSGVLAVGFSVTRSPFPARGLLTPAFIGISIACCAAYSGLVGTGDKFPFVAPLDRTLVSQRELRAFTRYSLFSQVASELSMRRIWLLHTSVSALAIGVIFLAAPFVEIKSSMTVGAGRSIEGRDLPAWPTTPPASADRDLARILYQKQVDEVGELRKRELDASRNSSDSGAAIWMGTVGLIVVVTVGTISRLRYSAERQRTSD
ncbi:hypothetical protein [Micromonospora sp. WMMD998]|uniref:hypothetical protein n=1 Tax=Micromonospora sp. WMMD998 TaxID=3016092 RepID=UPI00249B5B67|nr:hypothetical protein [Micromonospora sp. WMMD998]WFE38496.1 hypothetical protein O7619_08680 [Micromonospora sp. WMMD998]